MPAPAGRRIEDEDQTRRAGAVGARAHRRLGRASAFGRRAVAAVLVALVTGASGCSGGDEVDPVVATVDGLELTEDDVLRSYIDYLVTTGQNDTQALRERHVEALVDAYLLGAEAERRGLAADSAVQSSGRLARRRLVGSRFYEATVLDTLSAPTEAEVREAFRLGREQRVVRHLYYTDPAAATAAYTRLERGRPFLDEARDLYGTSDSLAGSLGAVSYWELDDAFADAAFSTPVGEVSPPVRSRLGYHIVLVEDRIRNPLLTEDEFTRRRKGVESQLRLRRRRLEGDSFVREFMAARNVSVSRPALAALARAVAELEEDALPDAQQGREAFTTVQKAEILDSFGPETPLAQFSLDGQPQTFTVADYVFWLDALPFGEARNRTGASLGRALRNEALARAGEAAGIDETPEVRHELARMERLRLADALRARLRAAAPGADSTRLARVARDLELVPRRTTADFWAVPFPTRAAAEEALSALRAAPDRAASMTGFESYEGAALRDVPRFATAVRSAPLDQAVLASTGDGSWAVLRVARRATEAPASGAEALAPFAAEADLLRRLRRERPIEQNVETLRRVTTPPAVVQGRR